MKAIAPSREPVPGDLVEVEMEEGWIPSKVTRVFVDEAGEKRLMGHGEKGATRYPMSFSLLVASYRDTWRFR